MQFQGAISKRKEMNIQDNLIFLNNASISPWPTSTVQMYTRAIHNISSTGKFGIGLDIENKLQMMNKTKLQISELIGGSKDGLGFTHGATEGMHHIASGLNFEDISGKKLILNDLEFIANSVVWQQLADKLHMKIEVISHNQGRLDLHNFEKIIDQDTALVCISSVQFSNGFRIDLKGLTEITHNVGAKIAVDAIQNTGAITIDVKHSDIDFLTSGAYKWLLSPMGIGFFYCRPDIIEDLNPISISWLGDPNFSERFHRKYVPYIDGNKFNTLSIVNPIMSAFSNSLDVIMRWDIHKIELYLFKITDYLIEKMHDELPNFKLLSPRENKEESSGIVLFGYKKSLNSLIPYLKEKKIEIELIHENIRISPHAYVSKQDIDHFIEEVKNWLTTNS